MTRAARKELEVNFRLNCCLRKPSEITDSLGWVSEQIWIGIHDLSLVRRLLQFLGPVIEHLHQNEWIVALNRVVTKSHRLRSKCTVSYWSNRWKLFRPIREWDSSRRLQEKAHGKARDLHTPSCETQKSCTTSRLSSSKKVARKNRSKSFCYQVINEWTILSKQWRVKSSNSFWKPISKNGNRSKRNTFGRREGSMESYLSSSH